MRVLITGGAGFQGTTLAQSLLHDGHEVTILNTHSEHAEHNVRFLGGTVPVVWGSVTDPDLVYETVRGHDAVVHLAALINVDLSLNAAATFLDVNVLGTNYVLEAARRHGARVVFSSSTEAYGTSDGGLMPETGELRPHSPYAASKVAADRLCFAYWMTYGTYVTITRPCNIYGSRQKSGVGGAVIPIFVDRALAKQPLKVFGTGEQVREYMHVDDVVRAYKLMLERDDLGGEVFNFGSGETPAIGDIARHLADRLGTTVEYLEARPGELRGYQLDSSKARALGFEPQIPFWEGLERYVQERERAFAS
jgi:nucleoside-diphosphate-sugar epimerase